MTKPILYAQRPGLDSRQVDDHVFVITAATIVHLNPVAAVIWSALEEPTSRGDLLALLRHLWPTVSPGIIARDLRQVLKHLLDTGLARRCKTGTGRRWPGDC